METQEKLFQSTKTKSTHFIDLLLFMLFLPFATPCFAHTIVQYWENRIGLTEGLILDPRVSEYSTSSNDNINSQAITLPNSISVTRFYYDLNATYGFTDDFFIFTRLTTLSSKVQNYPNYSQYSSFGLGDQLLGFAYRLFASEGGISMTLQGDVTIPAYQNNIQIPKPFLGDGSIDLTLGSFLELPLPWVSSSEYGLEAGAGYTYRSNGYSTALPWSLFLKHSPFHSGWLYQVGFRGNYSLATDKTTPSVALSDSTLGAGGSYLINAINPSWMLGQVSLGYKISNGPALSLLAAYPITGNDIPIGLQITLGAKFDFGMIEKAHAPHEPLSSKKPITPMHQFSSYDLEGTVLSTHDQLHLIKIDKGIDDGVEKGQYFDIFKPSDDLNDPKIEKLVARAKITHVKNNESVLIVVEYYLDQWIDKGFTVKRLLR